ncbi:hypothetical protein LCGC14_2598190 [marine sediment metagenome]|uniref:Uncharacterized protein n=1 Tax=marine sediment metagenome TaxID=412755 RepID=A0A0F9A9R6_9ZZZZ
MSYFEKKSEKKYLIKLYVKPNSKTQKITDDGEFLTIFLHSKAIQNKANKELINLMKNKLEISSNQIQIISGLKSSNKIIQINFLVDIEEQEIYNKLIN